MSNFISAIPPHGVTGASVYSTDNPILTIRLFGAIYATANSGFKSFATVVPPASSFPEITVATQSLADPTINCDMIFEPNGFIKAVAWSDGINPQAYIYAEDYFGNTSTISLPSGATNPDIAFANYEVLATTALVYEVVVTYTIGTNLYVEVYDLQNVGFSSFAINSTPTFSEHLSDDCTGLPHMDMWADGAYHYIINYASCHQFAVVFSEGSSGTHWGYLKAYVNDVDAWNTSATTFALLSTGGTPIENALTPDVACQYNYDMSYVLTQRMNITYSSVSAPPIPLPSPAPVIDFRTGTNSVSALEYDYTNNTTTSGPNVLQSGNIVFPRIESPGNYQEYYAATTPKYQIAYNKKGAGGALTDQVWGYNLLDGNRPMSLTDFGPTYQCMSACVGAGPESNGYLTSPIGNNQYTVGFYPWGNFSGPRVLSIFERNIDMIGGGALLSTNTYEVNNNPVDFYWDINRNMAISNCSNYGNDILTAWYNGTDIVYKHSTPDVMSFKAAPTNITSTESAAINIYPNPTSGILRVGGIKTETSYLITDVAGRTVQKGQLQAQESINTSQLANGQYIIRILESGKPMKNFPFLKN